MLIVRRLMLPLFLLAACIGSFVVSDRLGSTGGDAAEAEPIEALAVPLGSLRRLPEVATAPLNTELLRSAIPPAPSGLSSLSCLIMMVDGQVVHEQRADAPLVPGFAQLMLTGHAALDLLGADYRYRTAVMAEALPDEEGVVRGGLYLVGGGDPVLMSFNYAQGFRPPLSTHTSIEDLADRVIEAGVLAVDGGVVGVERRYDTIRLLPGWPPSYVEQGLAGPLSALQLDDGYAERAAANAGIAVPADEPALDAAERFDDLLEERGVVVAAPAVRLADEDQVPELVPIASAESAPLADIIFQMWAVNDASAAEMILKEMGFVDTRRGSTQAGGDAVQRIFADQGTAFDVAPRDASGLDPISTVSCRQLATAVDFIGDEHPTLDALPAFDLPAVFDGRLVDLDLSLDLRLVGGTVGEASGLVGRTVGDGRRVVIASIVNRVGGPSVIDLQYQRDAVAALDAVTVSIDPASIEAAPVGES